MVCANHFEVLMMQLLNHFRFDVLSGLSEVKRSFRFNRFSRARKKKKKKKNYTNERIKVCRKKEAKYFFIPSFQGKKRHLGQNKVVASVWKIL